MNDWSLDVNPQRLMIEFGLSNRLFCNYKFRNHLIQQVYLSR
jgi:hypothetical protein